MERTFYRDAFRVSCIRATRVWGTGIRYSGRPCVRRRIARIGPARVWIGC